MNPFPDQARWIWVGIFAFAIVEHLKHLRHMHGAHRLWHLGHVVMSVGMAWMFIPPTLRDTTRWPWQLLYLVATVLALGYAGVRLARGARVDTPWITLTVGLAGMWYMWAMRDGVARAPLTYLAALWFAAEAVGWLTHELCGRRDPPILPTALGPWRATAGWPGGGPYLAGRRPLAWGTSWLGCITLGLMAVGMAYMLAGMQIELDRVLTP